MLLLRFGIILEKLRDRHERNGNVVQWNVGITDVQNGSYTSIPVDGVFATFRNFGQNDTKRDRNAKSAAETPRAQ